MPCPVYDAFCILVGFFCFQVIQCLCSGELGLLRRVLLRGLEVVRLVGNHGLTVPMVINLARSFERRVSSVCFHLCSPLIV